MAVAKLETVTHKILIASLGKRRNHVSQAKKNSLVSSRQQEEFLAICVANLN